jgi:formylglycine-generating enzyme required for sulfatase activity
MSAKTISLFFSLVVVNFSCAKPPVGADDEVYIEGGAFMMGHDALPEHETCAQGFENWCSNYAPKHRVVLDEYFIDKFEVTIGQYKQCIADGFCMRPEFKTGSTEAPQFFKADGGIYDNFPVFGVVWAEAERYCLSKGRRLPTEAEWERAARGTDERDFPWGNTQPTCEQIPERCTPVRTANPERMRTVGSTAFDKTANGVMDMHGNAAELVSDYFCHDYYKNSPEKNPQGCAKTGEFNQNRLIRGTWFTFAPNDWTTANHAPRLGLVRSFHEVSRAFAARAVCRNQTPFKNISPSIGASNESLCHFCGVVGCLPRSASTGCRNISVRTTCNYSGVAFDR